MGNSLLSYDIDENLIVFESNPDFADNPRGFWEYIIANTKYKTFWVINNEETYRKLLEKGISCGLKNSAVSKEMISKAKILISSTFEFAYNKRIGQIHIAAWHGFPLKVIGFFDNATTDESGFDNLRVITTQTDVIPVTSRFGQVITSGVFATDPRKLYITGFPRNDLIFTNDGKTILESITKRTFGKSHLVLYMPTMRKGLKNEGEQFENNIFNYPDYDIEILNYKLYELDMYLFVKTHFEDDGKINKPIYTKMDRIVFLDNSLFTQELITIYHILGAFDSLITDYSSIYVDFLLLNRPIIFSCPDMDKYKEDRGFIADDPRYLMPGHIVERQSELLDVLTEIFKEKIDTTKEKRFELGSIYHRYMDACSSERLLKKIIKIDKTGEFQDISKREIQTLLNNENVLTQYGSTKCTAELYLGNEQGFSEQLKLQREYDIQPYRLTHQSMFFQCPSDVSILRFDPNITGGILIRNLKVNINGKHVSNYLVRNGVLCKSYIFFHKIDPQIEFQLNDSNAQCNNVEMEIKFDCCSLLSLPDFIIESLGSEMEGVMHELSLTKEKLENIENSRVWKLTHPKKKS